MATKRGLGKGLGALIPSGGVRLATEENESSQIGVDDAEPGVASPTNQGQGTTTKETDSEPHASFEEAAAGRVVPTSVSGVTFLSLPIAEVETNAQQPRTVFDEDAIAELATSLELIGLLQPIVVRSQGGRYELIAGERRLRAARKLGWVEIPAIVRTVDDDDRLRQALLENVHRVQLNALEEAAAYSQLLSDFGCTQDELAVQVGRSRSQIANTIRLLRLPPTVQNKVAAGVLTAGHARALLGLPTDAEMEIMANRIIAEGLSVRAVEEEVLLHSPTSAKPTKRKKAATIPLEYETAAEALSDRFETRVRIRGGAKRGQVVIDFGDVADLARIVDLMSATDESAHSPDA